MKKTALRGVAREISHGLVREMADRAEIKKSPGQDILEALLKKLVHEVVDQLEVDSVESRHADDVEARLQIIETKLQALTSADIDEDSDGDDDETDGQGSSLPNLKYAKPKYKDVESVLKYIESEGDQGGLKLVIMNFND